MTRFSPAEAKLARLLSSIEETTELAANKIAEAKTNHDSRLSDLAQFVSRVDNAVGRARADVPPKYWSSASDPSLIPDQVLEGGRFGLVAELERVATDIQRQAMAPKRRDRKRVREKIPLLNGLAAAARARIRSDQDSERELLPMVISGAERNRDARLAELRREIEAFQGEVAGVSPPWDDESWRSPSVPDSIGPFMPIGSVLSDQPDGQWSLPAIVSLPLNRPIVVTASQNRAAAHSLLLAAATRLMVSHPPGQVRFSFVDPTGMGSTVSSLLHLGLQDDKLIGGKAWSSERHIDELLVDLTQHMETVIQRRLRSDFDDIEAYNRLAGEISEPYRIVLVFDYPKHFTDNATHLLQAVLENGPRCGVIPLLHVEGQPESREHLALDRVEGLQVTETAGGLTSSSFGDPKWRLTPEATSDSGGVTTTAALAERWGEAAADVEAIEVSAQGVLELLRTPRRGRNWSSDQAQPVDLADASTWWRRNAVEGLAVPIGRSGANEVQMLELNDMSPHGLVVGRTGMGKTNLFHVLVSQAAILYSPDELQMYLIDFKEGVEFRTYAENALPHARVVAIQTIRDFGLAVLRSVDDERERRSELFKDAGVTHLSGYRGLGNELPRLLVVIDEFQEFFAIEDRLADEAARLMELLVRQGRIYGIHLLLGSQNLRQLHTFGGALGQMPLRVVFPCDASDGRLALGDDNEAARYLSRPGEAILNAAGGKEDANRPVQVTYLPIDDLEQIGARLRSHALQGGRDLTPRVFEGRHVPKLHERVRDFGTPGHDVRLWLGEPVSLDGPVAAVLRRQSGAHALLVERSDERLRAMLATLLAGFTIDEQLGLKLRVILLDGDPQRPPGSGDVVPELVEAGGYETIRPQTALEEFKALRDEINVRLHTGSYSVTTVLVLHQLKALRDLDPDAFPAYDDTEPALHDVLAEIVREGPAVGVHVVATADTVGRLEQRLGRDARRDMALRVAPRLSEADSVSFFGNANGQDLRQGVTLLFDVDDGEGTPFMAFEAPSAAELSNMTKGEPK